MCCLRRDVRRLVQCQALPGMTPASVHFAHGYSRRNQRRSLQIAGFSEPARFDNCQHHRLVKRYNL